MMTRNTPLLAKVSYGLSIAFLALAFTSSVSAVRAQSDDLALSWREMFVDPVLDAVKAIEDRLTHLEGKVAWFGQAFTSRQVTAHELCVADDAGARTCISKAQLDGLLKMMQAAAIEQPATVTDNVTEPKGVVGPAEVLPAPATETKASALDEAADSKTAIAAVGAPGPAAVAAQAALTEDTLDQNPMHTRSVPPSPAAPGRAIVTYPNEELITLWSDD